MYVRMYVHMYVHMYVRIANPKYFVVGISYCQTLETLK